MHTLKTLLIACAATVALSIVSSPASAFVLKFDENGNGCVLNLDNNCDTPLVFTSGVDPTGGVAGNVLIYTLPTTVSLGDVGIGEFGTGDLSDVLRFTAGDGTSLMIFYSELGGTDLADSGFPAGPFNILATEDANGNFTYDVGNIYNGISPEQTPEPLTLSIFGAGIAGMVAMRRRRKSAA